MEHEVKMVKKEGLEVVLGLRALESECMSVVRAR